eukprot:TRINITY_DN36825_c0_g1_i1.p1 TRINITY_DN36825_c0_g1~~TRINITY_DN36825_c0_g1_i1.p1  ORF type:complete len:556 (-),score=99.42 TRINITY_DN36825_c0_g1_i1:17-1684(-)
MKHLLASGCTAIVAIASKVGKVGGPTSIQSLALNTLEDDVNESTLSTKAVAVSPESVTDTAKAMKSVSQLTPAQEGKPKEADVTDNAKPTSADDTENTALEAANTEHAAVPAKEETPKVLKNTPKFGDPKCPCVGIIGINGTTEVNMGMEFGKVDYPADAFSYCKAWDDERAPNCKDGKKPGPGTGWCAAAWCFVDPCNCQLDELPKPASDDSYFPQGSYQGKPLWSSEATCGTRYEKKKPMPEKEKTQVLALQEKQCKSDVSERKWGNKKCRCIGIDGQPGKTEFSLRHGKHFRSYPTDAGATCAPWHMGRHPECVVDGDGVPAEWCADSWCFVDPCDCFLETAAKPAYYFGDHASVQGRPVYYSFATCGSEDKFTVLSKEACPAQHTKDKCKSVADCDWNGANCVNRSIYMMCGKSKEFNYDSFDGFSAHCHHLLKGVVTKAERIYTHQQLGAALKAECELDDQWPITRDEFFDTKRECDKFAEMLVKAREAELDGKSRPYDACCKLWWDERAPSDPNETKSMEKSSAIGRTLSTAVLVMMAPTFSRPQGEVV